MKKTEGGTGTGVPVKGRNGHISLWGLREG